MEKKIWVSIGFVYTSVCIPNQKFWNCLKTYIKSNNSRTWNCFECGDFKGDYTKHMSISALSLTTPVNQQKIIYQMSPIFFNRKRVL